MIGIARCYCGEKSIAGYSTGVRDDMRFKMTYYCKTHAYKVDQLYKQYDNTYAETIRNKFNIPILTYTECAPELFDWLVDKLPENQKESIQTSLWA